MRAPIRPDGASVEIPPIRVRVQGERFRFLPGGKALVYMQGTSPSQDFWLLDLATMKSRQLTRLQNLGATRTFDITPDGKQIVFDRLRENSEIVLSVIRYHLRGTIKMYCLYSTPIYNQALYVFI